MKRIELLEKITELEKRKNHMEKLKSDFTSNYFEMGFMSVEIRSRAWDRETSNDDVVVNKELFVQYLESEIEGLSKEVDVLIERLK